MGIARLAMLVCAATVVAGPREEPPAADVRAVRSGDRLLNGLLAEGYARSTTFRGLVDGISQTDALVYVEAGVCAFGHLDACLASYMAASGGRRYLRIVLTERPRRDEHDPHVPSDRLSPGGTVRLRDLGGPCRRRGRAERPGGFPAYSRQRPLTGAARTSAYRQSLAYPVVSARHYR
jgi:hypothetical protein